MQLQDLVRDYGRTLVEALAGCCFLAATWAASRTKRWLLEHVERERLACERLIEKHRQNEIRRHNETLRTFAEASVSGEHPTLSSLLNNAERDWSVESSPEPFVPPPMPVISKPSPSAGQRSTPQRSPNPVPTDWSDDELPTMIPVPGTKWSPPNDR